MDWNYASDCYFSGNPKYFGANNVVKIYADVTRVLLGLIFVVAVVVRVAMPQIAASAGFPPAAQAWLDVMRISLVDRKCFRIGDRSLIAVICDLSPEPNTMKLTIVEPQKVHSSFVNSLDRNSNNPPLLAQWQVVKGRLQCRWVVD